MPTASPTPTLDLLIGVNRLLAEAEKVRALRDCLIAEAQKQEAEVDIEQKTAEGGFHASR